MNMKYDLKTITIVLCSLIVFPASASLADQSVTVNDQIAELNRFIIPPSGTEKADVDAIYGEPEETKELHGKGSATDYPMQTYQLFPLVDGRVFRAFLYVTYRDGRVWRAGINHSVVIKNRADNEPGTPENVRQKEEIERENRQVLTDLQDIRDRFAGKLKSVSWNKTKTQEIHGKVDVGFRPEVGIEYTLAGTWLYRPARDDNPGPAETRKGIAWSFANELVYRTALSKEYVVPATVAGPINTGWYRVGFGGKDGKDRLVVEVDVERRVGRLSATRPSGIPDNARTADGLTIELGKVDDRRMVGLTFKNDSTEVIELEIPVEGAADCYKYFQIEAQTKDGGPAQKHPLYAPFIPPYTVRIKPRGIYVHRIQPSAYPNATEVHDLRKLRVQYTNPLSGTTTVSNWLIPAEE